MTYILMNFFIENTRKLIELRDFGWNSSIYSPS